MNTKYVFPINFTVASLGEQSRRVRSIEKVCWQGRFSFGMTDSKVSLKFRIADTNGEVENVNKKMQGAFVLGLVIVAAVASMGVLTAYAADQIRDQDRDQLKGEECIPDCTCDGVGDQTRNRTNDQVQDQDCEQDCICDGVKDQTRDRTQDQLQDQTCQENCVCDLVKDQTQLQTRLQIRDC